MLGYDLIMALTVCVLQLHTDVLTVNLFSCDGQPIIVNNLTSEHVELAIPHNTHAVSLSPIVLYSVYAPLVQSWSSFI